MSDVGDPQPDTLALPIRARLFDALLALGRPAATPELAERVGRHPNTVRVQLQILAEAGLIDRRVVHGAVGRPRHEWTVAPRARERRRRSETRLGAWLARALRESGDVESVERTGRDIGREVAPERAGRSVEEAMRHALDALGFAPSAEPVPHGARFVLGNCPYRDAVRQNQPVVCGLHRGITRGLLDRLAPPGVGLTNFVARDPDTAGCLVELGPS